MILNYLLVGASLFSIITQRNSFVLGYSYDFNGHISSIYSSDVTSSDITETTFYSPDPNDYLSLSLIFGSDDRVELTNDSDYLLFPNRTVCYIESYYDYNNDGFTDLIGCGTGALVGPHTILSCEHLVFDNDNDIFSYKLIIYPGGHRNSSGTLIQPYGSYIANYLSCGAYNDTGNPADDWSLIDIPTNVGNSIGYMGVSAGLSNGDIVRLYGYHGDYSSLHLGYGPGIVSNVQTYTFLHNCDAISGSSGGPITTGTSTIVGIHHGGYSQFYDQACKISSFLVNWVYERF